MAESDSIWTRGGVPVEQLPDPFDPPPTPPAEEPAPKPRRRWPLVLYALAGLLFLLILWLAVTAPLSRALEPLDDPAMLLISDDGQAIARRGAIKEAPVEVATLRPHTPAAFVAIEDRRFFRHWGIDPRGIGRALFANVSGGGVRQGGSTITQQLAKTAFLSSDRTFRRKGQEVIIAFWLEGWLSKEEILSRYLSSVYFGDGVYGLRAAARHYFDRDPEKLTLGQSAMLAGLVQAPSRLAPTRNLKGAQARSWLVLRAMAETGAITPAEQRKAALAVPVRRRAKLPVGTYFADWVAPQAQKSFESDFGEIRVSTTLDSRLQRIAVRSISRAPLGQAQAALVAMRPNGEIVAMVGGRSYSQSPFNRATQARRQPGSAFKLFVYLAALRAGWTPDSLIEDEPVTIGGWSPVNSDGVNRGRITLREAFQRSSNAATVRLAEAVGRGNVMRAARDLGISTPLPDKPSLALGTAQMSLLELTAAYAAISGGRYPVSAHGIRPKEQAVDGGGFGTWFSATRTLDRRRDWAPMLDLLYAAANKGTGKRAAVSVPSFGKTGTTQENRDALFVGFAGDLVVGVWVGRDDNSSLGKVTGGTVPARIWHNFMVSALSVDNRRGPERPGDYRRREPERDDAPTPLPSPLPPEWSDFTKRLREAAEELEEMFEEE